MHRTDYPEVNRLLGALLSRMHNILGDKLVGLYLFGSAVLGDFDAGVSDVDLLAALTADLDTGEFSTLQQMHEDIVAQDAQWDNRLEIAYASRRALQTYKTQVSTIGIISPGEPFYLIEAGVDWLVNWYMVLAKGVTLYGLPPQEIIAPTSQAEFVQAVKALMRTWHGRLHNGDSRPFQSYSILTLCRGWYTCTHGEQVSKQQAAHWAQERLPRWAALIEQALEWRRDFRDSRVDHRATLAETRRFVEFMLPKFED